MMPAKTNVYWLNYDIKYLMRMRIAASLKNMGHRERMKFVLI